MNELYLDDGGRPAGPYPVQQIREFLRDSLVTPDHLASGSPEGPWTSLRQLGLLALPAAASSLPAPAAISPVPTVQVAVLNPVPQRQTSGLAIGAFVCALLIFIPGIDLITWLPALILGHMALGQTRRDPTLGGRGLAVAALWITYIVLAIGAIAIAFWLLIVVGLLTAAGSMGQPVRQPF